MSDPTTTMAELGAPNLAIDVLPDSAPGTFLLDVSEVDGPDRVGWGTEGWTNIVCDVTRVRTVRGAQRLEGPRTRAEAGLASVQLTDTGRRFDPMANADAIHPGTPFRVRVWDYQDALAPVESRRNRVPNPRGAVSATGWTANAGTGGTAAVSQVATGGPDGGSFVRATWSVASTALGSGQLRADGRAGTALPIPVTAGEVLSGAMQVRASLAQRLALVVTWFTATGVQTGIVPTSNAGAAQAVPANTWTRLTFEGITVPAGATHCLVGPQAVTGTGAVLWPAGATLDASAALLEAAATAGEYFDGSTAADADLSLVGARSYSWAGSANVSQSVGFVRAMVPQLWSAVLFTGRIGTDLQVAYQQEDPPVVTFTAVDVISRLARFSSVGRADPGVGDGDNLKGRLARVLTEVGLPASVLAADSDPAYVATLASSPLAGGWEDVLAAADAELGRVWATKDDTLVTRARGSELTGTVRGTLSDWHMESVAGTPHCCYRDPVVHFGTEGLVNRAVGARRVPNPGTGATPATSALVQVDDVLAQAQWTEGVPVAHEDRALELQTDAQLQPWAEWLVLTSSAPELRVDSVSLVPGDVGPEAWEAVCNTDVGDRWYFRLHPTVGEAVERTLGVLGIEHDVTPDGWDVTFTTVEAPTPGDANPMGWFTLDLSTLDEDDILAPFGGREVFI